MPMQPIFNLKDATLDFAAKKDHKSPDDTYGVADTLNYGHVKLLGTIESNDTSGDGDAANIGAIKEYVLGVQSAITTAIAETIPKIDTTFNTESLNAANSSAVADFINTSINNLQELLEDSIQTAIQDSINPNNIDLNNPKKISETEYTNLNEIQTPGYYIFDKDEPLSVYYENIPISYKNALITVEKSDNIIQYIKTTQNNKLDGYQYMRTYDGNWSELQIIHAPSSSRNSYIATQSENCDIIEIEENTAGFIIHWVQTDDDMSYEITQDLYEYADMCTFDPHLPIGNHSFIFSDLIGKADIKIDKQRMQIRSTLPKHNKIKNVDVSFFIPRIR